MARYTGPKTKISRRFGVALFGPSKALERKNYGPGMHGPKGSRRKQSEYAVALAEKQKLRYQYGVLERQFRRYFNIALTRRGVTGETLLQLLETRLDNIIYRLGFANSRSAARQMVSHGHVQVNGRKVDVSSFNVKAGRRHHGQRQAPVPAPRREESRTDPDHARARLARRRQRSVQRQSLTHSVARGDCPDRQRTVDRRTLLPLISAAPLFGAGCLVRPAPLVEEACH